MLLNINKTTELYKIKEDNEVANNFLFLFQNTDSKRHTYDLEVVGNDDIVIERFKPFSLAPNKLRKKVVVLSTKKRLVTDNSKDTPITITIRAFAKDDPKKISVIREAVFIYPRADKFK